MISHHLKEDSSDIAVKTRLWEATQRELLGFVERYAAHHVVGCRVSDGQEDVACAAKAKGYPKTLVRDLGSLSRRGLMGGVEATEALRAYRVKIGLASSRQEV